MKASLQHRGTVQVGSMDRHTRSLCENLTAGVQPQQKPEDSSVGNQRGEESDNSCMVDRHQLV